MSEPDPELDSLIAKRMAEMKSNVAQSTGEKTAKEKPKRSARDTLISRLGYRGLEVLQNAEAQHPDSTRAVVAKMVELIEAGELLESISGGQLLALFSSVGIRVRMETRISVESDGKRVPLADKLSAKSDDSET